MKSVRAQVGDIGSQINVLGAYQVQFEDLKGRPLNG